MNNSQARNLSTITFKVERVPTKTRNQFKSACAAEGRNMRDVVIEFMGQYGEFQSGLC